MIWPPNYTNEYARRQKRLVAIRTDPALARGAIEYYKTRPAEFIGDWCVTYDPRNAGTGRPTKMPFVLFDRQADFVEFLMGLIASQTSGLVEKSRDMGATWLCCGFSVWLWCFWDGAAVGWGSRKEQLVDKIGDPDSIFEKMRMIINMLPREFWPRGFAPDTHMTYMKIINPATDATITGEAGDNIGRGGRKLIYFKDESAHYERPEKIEAALSDNTNVQVDISSVNGLGNVFHRRRENGIEWEPGQPCVRGKTNVFVMDWRDHPAKTDAWYAERKAKFEDDGLSHIFAQEVDRNYASSVDGVIIPAEWVAAAIDAHEKLGFDDSGRWMAALDVADEGRDKNAMAARKGVVLRELEEWGSRDVGVATRKVVGLCQPLGPMEVHYDSIGVGAGVKSEANRLKDDKLLPKGMRFVPWNAASSPNNPLGRVIEGDAQSLKNEDFYSNLKAQGWWELRLRFQRTYRAVTEGVVYPPDQLISLPSKLPYLRKLQKELSQPTISKNARLKLVVDKTPEGTPSPNLGDAVMMLYWPAQVGASGFLDLMEQEKAALDARTVAEDNKQTVPKADNSVVTGPEGWTR